MHTVTKSYKDLPAAHRQPNHRGHCRWIHGHDWAFDITFGCDKLDDCGFVIDLGALGHVRDFLNETFDHTLLVNEDDKMIQDSILLQEIAKLVVVPNCGMEGLAQFVFERIQKSIGGWQMQYRGLRVIAVTCFEDSKNSATYS